MLKSGYTIKNYQIIEAIAGTSMGVVYRVQSDADGTTHALRTLGSGFAIDAETRSRYKKSQTAQMKLNHPNIIGVKELVEDEDVIAVVTDLAHGSSLAEIFGHRAGKQYSLRECLDIVGPLVDALAYAHQKGVVHRGLQPDRILLDKKSKTQSAMTPRIIDFDVPGILCHGTDVQRSPANFGAAPYMSPEIAKGELEVDARADVFAIGMLCWRMLSGRLPVNPMDLVSVIRVYSGEVKLPSLSESRPSLPAAFRALVDRCLSIDPEGRPADASSVRDELASVVPGYLGADVEIEQINLDKLDLEIEVIEEVEVVDQVEVRPFPTPPPIPFDIRPNHQGFTPITERQDHSLPGTVTRNNNGPSQIEEPTAFYRARVREDSSVFGTAVQHIVGKSTMWALCGGLGLAIVAVGGWYSKSTANQLQLKPLAVAQRATVVATVQASEVQPSDNDEKLPLEVESKEIESEVELPSEKKVQWRRNKGPCKELVGEWRGKRRHFRVEAEFTEKGRRCTGEVKLYEDGRFVGINRYKVSSNEMHLVEGRGKTRLKAFSENITGDHHCWFSIRPRSRNRYIGRGCGGKLDLKRVQD